MRPDRKKIIGIAFLAIPFLAMLLMIATNMRNVSHQEYRLEIVGYDPRDFLKGHYLVFRYKWDVSGLPYACACISGDPLNPEITKTKCSDFEDALPKQCKTYIRVHDQTTHNLNEQIHRFYIPEQHAPRLEKMLRSGTHKFEVGIVPRGGGQAQLRELYVDGLPLDEYLRRFPEDLPAQ